MFSLSAINVLSDAHPSFVKVLFVSYAIARVPAQSTALFSSELFAITEGIGGNLPSFRARFCRGTLLTEFLDLSSESAFTCLIEWFPVMTFDIFHSLEVESFCL